MCGSYRDIKQGDILKSKNFGYYRVLELILGTKAIIEFVDTGFRKEVGSKELLSGTIRDHYKINVFGVGFVGSGEYPATITFNGKNKPSRAYDV